MKTKTTFGTQCGAKSANRKAHAALKRLILHSPPHVNIPIHSCIRPPNQSGQRENYPAILRARQERVPQLLFCEDIARRQRKTLCVRLLIATEQPHFTLNNDLMSNFRSKNSP
jgi:hypothetical protein